MKKLVLCRHAKSSWDFETDDLYRPLNKRGIANAPMIAHNYQGAKPDLIVCSPAVRAYSTALSYLNENNWAFSILNIEPNAFHSSLGTLVDIVKSQDNSYELVWLVGHNPSLNDLVEYLLGKSIGNLVTAARVHLELPVRDWKEINEGIASLDEVFFPKMYN